MIWIIVTFLVLILGTVIASSKCERILCTPRRLDRDHEFEYLKNYGYDVKKIYDTVPMDEFSMDVPNGYTLKGVVMPAEKTPYSDGKTRAIIMVHGRTANRYTMLSHGEIWHRLGFNVIIYEQRAHGVSGGDDCSMGYYESQDLVFLAGEMKKRFPDDTIWGLGGESMGAATLIIAAEKLPWLSFIYEDGGYATLREEVAPSLYYKAKLPKFPFTPLVIMFFNMRHEFTIDDVRPIDSVKKIKAPMLFVHGGEDKFVPTPNVYLLYEAKEGAKEIKVFEGAPHVKAVLMHHEEYFEMLRDFCIKYGIVKEEA